MRWDPKQNRFVEDDGRFTADAVTDLGNLTVGDAPYTPGSINTDFAGLNAAKGSTPAFNWGGLNNPKDTGLGFNASTLGAAGNALQGIGSLASGWAAIKGLGLAKDSFAHQKDMAEKNYAAMATTVNNRIADQNAWKAAQGRTDLSKLVV